MQIDLKRDFNSIELKEICPGWCGGNRNIFVLSSQLQSESPLSVILWDLADMMNTCQIFIKIWRNHIERLSERTVSQAEFVDEVWTGTINDCCRLVVLCSDGSALADEVDNLFAMLDIEEHLKLLHEKLKCICPKDDSLKIKKSEWISHVAKQITSYRSFKKCENTAVNLLKIKDKLEWDGCFDVLQSITRKVSHNVLRFFYYSYFRKK